jgi:hypothetical protein
MARATGEMPLLADLVEEHGAAVRHLEPAAPFGHRAGERAPFVTEQLALEQRLGERRAVDRDERPVRARTVGVDRGRDQLLARSAFAAKEHRRVGRSDPGDETVDGLHRGALADEVVRDGGILPEASRPGAIPPVEPGRARARRSSRSRPAAASRLQRSWRLVWSRTGREDSPSPTEIGTAIAAGVRTATRSARAWATSGRETPGTWPAEVRVATTCGSDSVEAATTTAAWADGTATAASSRHPKHS